MRKIIFAITALALLVSAPSVLAQDIKTKSTRGGETVTIEKDEVIDRDYFVGGDTVRVYGTINGDLYVAGGQVFIEGLVNGDLLAAGGTVDVNGEVTQDARVFGGQVSIRGKVGRNLTIGAGNAEIASSAELGGSVAAGAGNLTVSTPILGNLNAGAGNLTLSSTVDGDVEVGVGILTLSPDAQIAGDLIYYSEEEAEIAEGAVVAGSTTRNNPAEKIRKEFEVEKTGLERAWKGIGQTGKIIGFLSSLFVGLLFLKLFPNYSQKVIETFKKQPAKSGLLGIGALVLTPITVIVVAITMIGFPIAMILLAFYFIYLYIAKLFVVLWAGQYLLNRAGSKQSVYMTYFVGLIAFTVITLLPIVGGIIKLFALLVGFGAMLTTCKSSYFEARDKKFV